MVLPIPTGARLDPAASIGWLGLTQNGTPQLPILSRRYTDAGLPARIAVWTPGQGLSHQDMDMPKTPPLGCLVDLTRTVAAKLRIPSNEVLSRRAHLGYSAPGCTRGVDWSRVALFREAIASGTYELRPLRVAGSLMRFESLLYLGGRPRPNTLSRGDCGGFASAEDLLERVYELLGEESNYLRADLRELALGRGRQPGASDEGAAGGLPPAATAR